MRSCLPLEWASQPLSSLPQTVTVTKRIRRAGLLLVTVISVRSLQPILEKLARAQSTFFRAADSIPFKQWSTKPDPGRWSAAEVVAHLVMVERAIVGGADRSLQSPPRPVPFWKRFHLPLWLVERRWIRRKTPLAVDPLLISNKEEMLGALRGARERTLAFLEETRKRDLSLYSWAHPYLGTLNVYEWFELVAMHQLRHTEQVSEIFSCLPKVVEVSPKEYIFAYRPVKTDSGVDFEINPETGTKPAKNRPKQKVLEK